MNIVVFFSPGKTIDDLMMIDQCGTIVGLVDVPTYVYLGHSIAYRLYHMYSTRIFQNNKCSTVLYLFIMIEISTHSSALPLVAGSW